MRKLFQRYSTELLVTLLVGFCFLIPAAYDGLPNRRLFLAFFTGMLTASGLCTGISILLCGVYLRRKRFSSAERQSKKTLMLVALTGTCAMLEGIFKTGPIYLIATGGIMVFCSLFLRAIIQGAESLSSRYDTDEDREQARLES